MGKAARLKKERKMAEEAAAQAVEEHQDPAVAEEQEILMPETLYHTNIIQLHRMDTPNGRVTLLKFMVPPGHTHSFRLSEEQCHDLASKLTGGIARATAADLARLGKPVIVR